MYTKAIKKKGTVVEYYDNKGNKEIKKGGHRNWRNNNPGNIEMGKYAKKYGAIGDDGRFAIFPTYEIGQKAKSDLISKGKNYKGKTLEKVMEEKKDR